MIRKLMMTEHCDMIRGMVPPDRLLEWSIEDGWEPLCKFLGKEIPNEPFPHANATGLGGGWKAREEMATKRWVKGALINLFWAGTFLVGAVVAWMKYRG